MIDVELSNIWGSVSLPDLLSGEKDRTKARIKVREMLARFELTGLEKHRPSQLSGGQQQRAAIARALMTKPAIVLGDEPTGNLDSVTSMEVVGLLKNCAKKYHQTVILVTHQEEVAQMADRIIRIEDGRIAE